mgnify:CR=1 FL=1
MFGTMTSWFGRFTEEEMALIQSEKKSSLYAAVVAMSEKEDEAAISLSVKCRDFLKWFSSYRNKIAYEPIHKILRRPFFFLHRGMCRNYEVTAYKDIPLHPNV